MSDETKPAAPEPAVLESSVFSLRLVDGAVTGLKRVGDAYDTEYILEGEKLGDCLIHFRLENSGWQPVCLSDLAAAEPQRVTVRREGSSSVTDYALGGDGKPQLRFSSAFRLDGEALYWDLSFENLCAVPLEIGDLGMPFPMNSNFVWDKEQTATKGVFRHAFLSGNDSYLFWMRPNSVPPYLLMTPEGDARFEYFDTERHGERKRGFFRPFVHSLVQGEAAKEKGTRWRQPHTSRVLAPQGSPAARHAYRFKFQWARSYDHIRDLLVQEGLMDIQVVPGMTVPADLSARFSLRTKWPIRSIQPEFPRETRLESLGEKAPQTQVYEVQFSRLGENLLTVHYGDGRSMVLEFFVTEPLQTLIEKRSAFLAKSQHRDPSKWYNGLITDWNMESGVLLSPDNYDRIKGWRIYMVTCDDPGLCKAPYMAAKNVEYPSAPEIEALDYYIKHFIWGGLQCTTEEEHPYALYGIPDWKKNRESEDPGKRGQLHIWRPYDYPHILMLYFKMYQIARFHTGIPTALTAREYLERAFGTARAMFIIPKEVADWSALHTGFYNELVIDEILEALEAEGMRKEAAELRDFWEQKVKFFVCDKPSLFGSEYPFDSTGFESTAALAAYALRHAADGGPEKGGPGFDVTTAQARAFLELQMEANLLCRGWLEPAYYLLGSDYRGGGMVGYTLSYMSQMGGWGVMDYALHRTPDPVPYLRLAYASYLSSWALMNTGTPQSNYGFWFPGKEHDGGAGGGFEPAPYGQTWLEQPHHRGSWYYGCEIDLGFGGALRMANTLLVDDPLFGLMAYGGVIRQSGDAVEVIPRDGLRRRFHVVRGGQRLDLVLERDHFAAERPLTVNADLSRIAFLLEEVSGVNHATRMTVGRLQPGKYRVLRDGKEAAAFEMSAGREAVVQLPVLAGDRAARIEIVRQ